MAFSLDLLNQTEYERLLRITPKEIRSKIVDRDCSGNLFVVNHHWLERPVDVQVGDVILVPKNAELRTKSVLEAVTTTSNHLEMVAQCPGIAWVGEGDWSVHIRVMRKSYMGRAKYRFEDDPDEHT